MKGTPFTTDFTLTVDKTMNGLKPKHGGLKCEFFYKNEMGKVVIPTKDTADFLK